MTTLLLILVGTIQLTPLLQRLLTSQSDLLSNADLNNLATIAAKAQ